MQHGASVEPKFSKQLHEKLCDCGFTLERIRYQSVLVDLLEDYYKDLYDHEQYLWFIAGSFGDGWGNNLFTIDGRTDEHESDIDWTCLMLETKFHFEECCTCDRGSLDDAYVLRRSNVREGHIPFSFEQLREPAEPHKAIGMRPKVDECTAYPCCSVPKDLLKEEHVEFLRLSGHIETSKLQLIQASRPGHESLELRFSFASIEKKVMRNLNTIQGQLFILIKYLMMNVFNLEIFAFKSYHAKTLLFHVLYEFRKEENIWEPSNLISLLCKSLDMLVQFINIYGSAEERASGYHAAMESFFLKDCFIYFHKKVFSPQPHKALVGVINEVKNNIVTHLENYSERLIPISPQDGLVFHPYALFPIRLTLQFSRPINADNLYNQMKSCLQELTVLEVAKKTEFLRHVESLPPNAFTASLCLKVMTHLKFGDKDKAKELLVKHQYHTAQYLVPFRAIAADEVEKKETIAKLKDEFATTDTAWCFVFTYDQMRQLDFSFLGNDLFAHCIFTSNTYPVDVVIDFNCLSRMLHVLLRNDQSMLQAWASDLSSQNKKAALAEVYLCHRLLTLRQRDEDSLPPIFTKLNESIIAGMSDRMFLPRLIASFALEPDRKEKGKRKTRKRKMQKPKRKLEIFCEWLTKNAKSACLISIYCICKLPLDSVSAADTKHLLSDAVHRSADVGKKTLSYQDYVLILKMKRHLCKLDDSYLTDSWQKRLDLLQDKKRLNMQEVFIFLKAATWCGSKDNLSFALDLLRKSSIVFSFLKLKDFRLLAQCQSRYAKLEPSYLHTWLADIRRRLDAMLPEKAPFLIVELAALVGCLSQRDASCAASCREILREVQAKAPLHKADDIKLDMLLFSLSKIS